MKMIIVLALAVSLTACNNAGNRNSENKDTLKDPSLLFDTTSEQMSPARRDTLVLYQTRRDKTQVEIDEIRKSLSNGELKDDLKARSEELEEKLNQLNRKIDEMGRASGRSWNKLKLEMDSLLADLDQTITKARNNLKK